MHHAACHCTSASGLLVGGRPAGGDKYGARAQVKVHSNAHTMPTPGAGHGPERQLSWQGGPQAPPCFVHSCDPAWSAP
eukprot:1207953-Alexandrium_andersonii.AAC.1